MNLLLPKVLLIHEINFQRKYNALKGQIFYIILNNNGFN